MSDVARLLDDWQNRLAIITRNANDLYEAEFSKRIRNRLRDGRYTGLTQQRATIAVNNLTALMDDYLVLARVIESAIEQNKGGLFQAREVTDAKVRELLEGQSVELPSVHVPLPRRDLLVAADAAQRTTPAALLGAMQAAFSHARDIISEIDQAESGTTGLITDLKREQELLRQRAMASGADQESSLLMEAMTDLTDPLQMRAQIEACKQALAKWSDRLTQWETLCTEGKAALEAADASLNQLNALLAARTAGIDEDVRLFGAADVSAPEIQPSHIADLRDWLSTLQRAGAERRWQAVITGAKHFMGTVTLRIETAKRDRDRACARVDAYTDLKARFKVLRIKAQTLHDREQIDTQQLASAETDIAEGFRLRPVPMALQRERVARYEHLLLLAGKSNKTNA